MSLDFFGLALLPPVEVAPILILVHLHHLPVVLDRIHFPGTTPTFHFHPVTCQFDEISNHLQIPK